MVANVILVVERTYPQSPDVLFAAFTEPSQMSKWRGAAGWHVDPETVHSELKLGGQHHHVKVNDADPSRTIVTDAIFTEFFPPDVFVAKQRIAGAEGHSEETPLELRVEFVKTGKDGTLVRVVQGPYDPAVASDFSDGWESELARLATYLESPERS